MEQADSDKKNRQPNDEVEEVQQPERKPRVTPLPMSTAALLASNSMAEVLGPLQNQGESFRQIAEQMRGIGEAFQESVGAAAYLSKSLDLSVGAVAREMANSYSDVMKPIGSQFAEICSLISSRDRGRTTIKPIIECQSIAQAISGIATPLPAIPNFPTPLPIIKITSLLAPLAVERDPTEQIGILLERELQRPRADIERELTAIAQSDRDASFNVMGYEFLFELERFLRNLIVERIFSACKNDKDYQNHVPKSILDEWKERKAAEEKDPLIEGEYREIDYSDFTHLKMIFEKRSNRNMLSDLLNEGQLSGIVSRLQDLDPIRKKIAHSRLLTEKEFTRLRLYSEDIQKLFQKPNVDV